MLRQEAAWTTKGWTARRPLATGLRWATHATDCWEAIAHGPLRFVWRQMKQNAGAARAPIARWACCARALRRLGDTLPFETHYVAHSAGSFVVGHLMALGQAATSVSA